MTSVSISHKGDFKNMESFLKTVSEQRVFDSLSSFGAKGVSALSAATPVNSGKTASSWDYEISGDGQNWKLTWTNSNINEGVNIAIILQYGHGTGTGGYVQGQDYINPAIRSVIDDLTNTVWKAVQNA